MVRYFAAPTGKSERRSPSARRSRQLLGHNPEANRPLRVRAGARCVRFLQRSLLAVLCGSMRAQTQVPHTSSGGMATDGGRAQGTRSIGDASTILDEPAHRYPNNHTFYFYSDR